MSWVEELMALRDRLAALAAERQDRQLDEVARHLAGLVETLRAGPRSVPPVQGAPSPSDIGHSRDKMVWSWPDPAARLLEELS